MLRLKNASIIPKSINRVYQSQSKCKKVEQHINCPLGTVTARRMKSGDWTVEESLQPTRNMMTISLWTISSSLRISMKVSIWRLDIVADGCPNVHLSPRKASRTLRTLLSKLEKKLKISKKWLNLVYVCQNQTRVWNNKSSGRFTHLWSSTVLKLPTA